MTDNEKASTFIGWLPDQKCSMYQELIRWPMRKCVACNAETGNIGIREEELPQYTEHIKLAPDMSDPKNWIQALKNIITPDLWLRWNESVYLTLLGHDGPPIVESLARYYDEQLAIEQRMHYTKSKEV